MNSINLLPKEVQQGRKYTSIQRTVYVVTSIVLSAYIVITAALFGWWIYLSQTSSAVSTDMAETTAQISALADTEQLVQQLKLRTDAIQSFLGERVLVSTKAEQVLSTNLVTIADWSYTQGGLQTINLTAGRVDAIEEYASSLPKEYAVRIDSVDRSSESVWKAKLTLTPSTVATPTQ